MRSHAQRVLDRENRLEHEFLRGSHDESSLSGQCTRLLEWVQRSWKKPDIICECVETLHVEGAVKRNPDMICSTKGGPPIMTYSARLIGKILREAEEARKAQNERIAEYDQADEADAKFLEEAERPW